MITDDLDVQPGQKVLIQGVLVVLVLLRFKQL